MLRLSPDMLSATCELLDWIKQKYITNIEDTAYSQEICHIMVEDILDVAKTCGFVEFRDSVLQISDEAEVIVEEKQKGKDRYAYRLVLYHYILSTFPSWAGRIPYGRQEACLFMNRDEHASFSEAGLLSEEPGKEEVSWWDKISAEIRGEIDKKKNAVGRLGEMATIRFEKERTGVAPIWKSIDTNCAGFDIQSVQSRTDPSTRLIEVKSTSNGFGNAWFHISSNEWNVAKISKHYYFYLWNFEKSKSTLAIITPKMIEKNLPTNGDNGEWESVRIPFKLYEDFFSTTGGCI